MGQMPPVFTGTITNPFPQFTQCVEAGNFNTESQYWQLAKAALLGGGIATIYEAAFGLSPACIALAVELAAIAGGMGSTAAGGLTTGWFVCRGIPQRQRVRQWMSAQWACTSQPTHPTRPSFPSPWEIWTRTGQ